LHELDEDERGQQQEMWVEHPDRSSQRIGTPALKQSITSRTPPLETEYMKVRRCKAEIHSFPKGKDSGKVAKETVVQ
jgi:hypothetical protein